MGDNGQGRVVILFLVVMGLTGAAAVPFFGQLRPQPAAAQEDELPVASSAPDPDEAIVASDPDEAEEETSKPKAKPRPRKPVTNWRGGGDVAVSEKLSSQPPVPRQGKMVIPQYGSGAGFSGPTYRAAPGARGTTTAKPVR